MEEHPDTSQWLGELTRLITEHCSGLGVSGAAVLIRTNDLIIKAEGYYDGVDSLLWYAQTIEVEGAGGAR